MPATAVPYLSLKADERQELRLPAILKEHAARVAALHGKSTSEFLIEVIATRVAVEMEEALTWDLSAAEVMTLLQTLASPTPETAAMTAACRKADELFGRAPAR